MQCAIQTGEKDAENRENGNVSALRAFLKKLLFSNYKPEYLSSIYTVYGIYGGKRRETAQQFPV